MAAYTPSVDAPATPRSSARVVEDHHRVVASLEAGRTARATTSARARSRSGQAGPSSLARPSVSAMAHTAATWPCGRERSMSQPAPASTCALPASDSRTSAIVSGGRWERLASVSVLTLPPSR